MRLLIADDDTFFRRLLEKILGNEYELVSAEDGEQAWEYLQDPDAPRLLVLDYVMPKMTGPELCRRIRGNHRLESSYVIILTAKNDSASLVCGLHAGADDYVTKPFEVEELRARLRVGERVIDLQSMLQSQVASLEDVLAREKQLQRLLPVCPVCRAVRNSPEYWNDVKQYLNDHPQSATPFDSICPACSIKVGVPRG